MSNRRTLAFSFSIALALASAAALAEPPEHHDEPHPEAHGGQPPHEGAQRGGAPHGGPHAPEPHPGPQGYQRPQEPQGWNNRPKDFDRGAYQHNFQAARSFHIGPYHRPPGWRNHHWGYGEVLPRNYWTSEYLIGDYWLFALEVPPVGYEWVRNGSDALLVSTSDGTILQVEYGVFG